MFFKILSGFHVKQQPMIFVWKIYGYIAISKKIEDKILKESSERFKLNLNQGMHFF